MLIKLGISGSLGSWFPKLGVLCQLFHVFFVLGCTHLAMEAASCGGFYSFDQLVVVYITFHVVRELLGKKS